MMCVYIYIYRERDVYIHVNIMLYVRLWVGGHAHVLTWGAREQGGHVIVDDIIWYHSTL